MKLRIISELCMCIVCLTISGCTSREITTQADEITISTWEYTGSNGAYACIEFIDNNACITLSSSKNTCIIQGICVFNDEYFTVCDNSMQRSFVFGYDFSGSTLGVTYNGHKADFNKKENKETE